MASAPTMNDVAQRAGVSRALVSLVMRDSPKVSEASRQKVLRVAGELGYRPNLMARSLASRCTMTVGVLLDDLHNGFYAEVADGLLDGAFEHGFRILFTAGERRPTVQERAIETLLELHTDGVVLVSPRLPLADLDRAAQSVPVVAIGEPLRSDLIDTVTNDEDLGAGLLVAHLAELGHERISHIDGGSGAGAQRRRDGYVLAMNRHGLHDYIRVIDGEFTAEAGYVAAGDLLRAGDLPTAIFAGNDLIAVGVMDRFDDAGVSVPEDVSVVGYDNTSLASVRRIGLTTIDQPRFAMGRLAFSTMMERIDSGRTRAVHHVVPGTFVGRRSSGRPRNGDQAPR